MWSGLLSLLSALAQSLFSALESYSREKDREAGRNEERVKGHEEVNDRVSRARDIIKRVRDKENSNK